MSSLLLLLGACQVKPASSHLQTSEDTKPPTDHSPTDESSSDTINGTDGEPLADLTPAPDQGTSPDDRPDGQSGGNVRTCDPPLTSAKPLRRNRLYAKTDPVKLGAAIVDGKASATAFWATGTVTPPSGAPQTGGSIGPDLTNLTFYLGWDDKATYDVFTTHLNGKNPLQIWADTMTPTSRRMTYSFATSAVQRAYHFDTEKRTAATPATGSFVHALSAQKGVGVSLAVTTASDCATGALADLLGRKPIVLEGYNNERGTLFDPELRSEIQKLLVRDGAEILLATITTRPDDTIDQLVKNTTCSPTDLSACEKVLSDLQDAADKFMGDVGAPTFDTLSSATDPDWAFLTFTTGDVATLAQ
jgi:hypothetical protein